VIGIWSMEAIHCEDTNSSPVWTSANVLKWKLPARIGGGGAAYLFAFKDSWIVHNKSTIHREAKKNSLPSLLLAGVCWNEVAGDPTFIDSVAHTVRSFDYSGPDFVDRHLTITKRPEKTSFGPVSMQLGVASKTLGLNIEMMSYADRRKLGACLEIDVFNISLAARHLRHLIDYDGLQDNPPELSDFALKLAASRYNRGTIEAIDIISSKLGYGEAILKRRTKLANLLS